MFNNVEVFAILNVFSLALVRTKKQQIQIASKSYT